MMKTLTVHLKSNNDTFFRFGGVASSESRDTHGEIIKQQGINLSLVSQGEVIVNAEHDNLTIGRIENAEVKNGKLYVEGIVYLKSIKAKRFFNLLKKDDPSNPVSLSIEFVNPEYSKADKNTLNQVVLTGIALIGLKDEPANSDTYAELLKSISRADLFNELKRRSELSPVFKNSVQRLLSKYGI
ncbi:MAG: hypothetical protein K2Q26_07780 [Bdellovibrionales bacterium]|nr:hypothetical protein [Bdellovibrionales bacterium]